MSPTNIIQAIPIPNITLKSMESGQSGIDDKSIDGYQPNGKYVIKTSSYYNDNTLGFNAFNANTNTYWECDNVNNNNYINGSRSYNKYNQSPYSGITPSSYLGGDPTDKSNTWITKVGPNDNKTDIPGEWIEIKLPYKIYLTSYSITTPTFEATNTFPKKFTLVSSTDGESWEYVDQQLIHNNKLPTKSSPTKTFSVTSYNKFQYFRLIITQAGDNLSRLRINTIKLNGTPHLDSVPMETFSTLQRSVDGFTNKYKKVNDYQVQGADLYRPTYSNYLDNTLESLDDVSKERLPKKTPNMFLAHIKNTAPDVLLYTGLLTGAVVTGLLITNMSPR